MALSIPPFEIVWDSNKALSNVQKHGIPFALAASVLLDPLALTQFDAVHSDDEERWFTLGLASDGRLMAITHTHHVIDEETFLVRLISARIATRHERQQYEQEPR